jgi:hypothetical protein
MGIFIKEGITKVQKRRGVCFDKPSRTALSPLSLAGRELERG